MTDIDIAAIRAEYVALWNTATLHAITDAFAMRSDSALTSVLSAVPALCDALDAAQARADDLAAARDEMRARVVDVVNGMGRFLTGEAVLKAMDAENPLPSWQARAEAAEARATAAERERDWMLAERAQQYADVAEAVAERDAARAQVAAVRALHSPRPGLASVYCDADGHEAPCPTLAVLDSAGDRPAEEGR